MSSCFITLFVDIAPHVEVKDVDSTDIPSNILHTHMMELPEFSLWRGSMSGGSLGDVAWARGLVFDHLFGCGMHGL